MHEAPKQRVSIESDAATRTLLHKLSVSQLFVILDDHNDEQRLRCEPCQQTWYFHGNLVQLSGRIFRHKWAEFQWSETV